MSSSKCITQGFSLTELMSVIAILGLLAGIILPRVVGENDGSKVCACHAQRGNIDIQAELWHNSTGSWPAASLSDIGADPDFFPEGIPNCPVDSSAYTFNPVTGRVIGHDH